MFVIMNTSDTLETWNFAEYIEEKSWDNPTTFLTEY